MKIGHNFCLAPWIRTNARLLLLGSSVLSYIIHDWIQFGVKLTGSTWFPKVYYNYDDFLIIPEKIAAPTLLSSLQTATKGFINIQWGIQFHLNLPKFRKTSYA